MPHRSPRPRSSPRPVRVTAVPPCRPSTTSCSPRAIGTTSQLHGGTLPAKHANSCLVSRQQWETMSARAGRLLQLLLQLEAGGPTTAATLAGELGVSVRTVHRDLAALAEAGVPVYTERGRGGGCRIVEGYRSRLTGISPAEADA